MSRKITKFVTWYEVREITLRVEIDEDDDELAIDEAMGAGSDLIGDYVKTVDEFGLDGELYKPRVKNHKDQ